jgi:hypothetical protein
VAVVVMRRERESIGGDLGGSCWNMELLVYCTCLLLLDLALAMEICRELYCRSVWVHAVFLRSRPPVASW